MLVRLLSSQIPKFWNLIKHAVDVSMPDDVFMAEEHFNNILQALLKDDLSCFMALNGDESFGLIVVRVIRDEFIDKNSLLIYAAYAFKPVPNDMYMTLYRHLSKYAKSIDCDNMIGYVSNKRLLEMARLVGADTSQTLVSFSVV